MTEGVSAGVTEGAGAERIGGSPGCARAPLCHGRLPCVIPNPPCVIPAKAGIHGHRQPSGFPLKTCGNDRGGKCKRGRGSGHDRGRRCGHDRGSGEERGQPGVIAVPSWVIAAPLLGHGCPPLCHGRPPCVIPAKAGIHGYRQPSGFPLKTCGNDRVGSAGMTEEAVRA